MAISRVLVSNSGGEQADYLTSCSGHVGLAIPRPGGAEVAQSWRRCCCLSVRVASAIWRFGSWGELVIDLVGGIMSYLILFDLERWGRFNPL